jgi:plastocyanin
MRTRLFGTFVGLSILSAALVLNPTPVKSADTAPANEVTIDNFTFGPAALTVPINTVVTWVNKDDVPHVVASTESAFKSKALDTDEKFSYTFSKPGTYPYYCPIHPKMTGKIVVQ